MKFPTFQRHGGLLLGSALRLLLLGAVWSGGWAQQEARAEPASATEYDFKATCLFHFMQFVKWPALPAGPLTIGILGDDPFGGALEKIIAGELVEGHKLAVKRARKVEDLKGCQIVFIANSEWPNINGILTSLGGANILTVGEHDGFLKQGGIIGFTPAGTKIRFEINNGTAQRSGLRIDSRLLKLGQPEK